VSRTSRLSGFVAHQMSGGHRVTGDVADETDGRGRV
jgi:hypothetical protein